MDRSQESPVTAPDCSYQMGRKEELCLQGLEVSWSNGAQYRQLSTPPNSTVTLTSQRHPEKLPRSLVQVEGTQGFFWLLWVFVDVHRLSLVAVSGALL